MRCVQILTNIFSGYTMCITVFYILENHDLGTWWVSMRTIERENYWTKRRAMTSDQINDKLHDRYNHLPNVYLGLSFINKDTIAGCGIERWLSDLDYKIKKYPEKYHEIKKLFMAGWNFECSASTLCVLHVFDEDKPIDKIFKKLVTSREGFTRCLNVNKNSTREEFLETQARRKVLRDIKKKQKPPKQSTIDKYGITEQEILLQLNTHQV